MLYPLQKDSLMNLIKFATIGMIALMSAACSTTRVDLGYVSSSAVKSQSSGVVQLGSFTDDRGEPSNWLGAIRGGFGNPLKNLETSIPVNKLVEAAFSDGLRSRGIDVQSGNTKRLITGSIKKLDCNQIVQREANAAIDIKVIDLTSQAIIFSRSYSSTKYENTGLATGVFASVEDLRILTEKALQEVIDKMMDDSELRVALGG